MRNLKEYLFPVNDFAEEYFNTRLPVVMKRIVQGGVRLAMILNRVFSDDHADVAAT